MPNILKNFSINTNQNISHGHFGTRGYFSTLCSKCLAISVLFMTLAYLSIPFVSAATISDAIQLQKSIDKKSAASQARIDKMADETTRIKSKYKDLLLKIESMRSYNEYLQKLVDGHHDKITSLNNQLAQVDDTNRSIVPLMERMTDTLENFIKLDIPFRLEERLNKVHELKDLLQNPNVTNSQKYQRIMQAYQRELAYGKTIGTYKGTLGGNSSKTVEYLRIGRIGLFYQSLDGKEQKYWNNISKKWEELPSEYDNSLHKARLIANKQLAPDLISLPVQPASKKP
ncbi:MAG: DUF3450 domain-containing protein [Gammaproteobacteria bacterium]|nr:DUF3450 domain-containing protein [Gammaproteobacteria bacterium]